MKMKKIYKILLLIAVCIIAVSGCKKEDKVSGTRIYYTDSEGVSLVEKGTRIKGKTKKAQINYVLGKVQKNTDNINYRSAFVKGVKIKNWSLHSKNLTVDFNRAYQKLSVTEEIVLRASVVQSLGQIDGVDAVLFTIEGEPLEDQNGQEIGYMQPSDFVQNTGSSLHAYQNETFRIIIGTKMYTIPPTNKHAEETVLRNHHDMLCTYHNANRKYLYPYCVGGKTGYTATANSTLVTYAEKDGMTLICVVMNTQSPNQFIDTVNLFDYAFDNFQVLNVAENDTDYSAETTVDNGNLNNIAPFVELDKEAVIVLPKTAEFSDTSSSVEYNDSDPEIAGSITYTYAGRNVGKADIKTTGVVVEGYAFDNESTEEEEQEAVSTVQVKPIVVVLLIVAVILLGVLLFFLKRFYDNYYIIKHNRAVRRDRKDQKRRIRKKRRRRRRWR